MNVFGDTETIEEYGTAHPEATDVEGVVVVGYDPAIDKWLALRWTGKGTIWLVGGGKEPDETFEHAAIRELKEETGYANSQRQVQLGGFIRSHYYNEKKHCIAVQTHWRCYLFWTVQTSGNKSLNRTKGLTSCGLATMNFVSRSSKPVVA